MVLAFFFLFFLSVRSLRVGRVYMFVCVHMYMQVHIHVCVCYIWRSEVNI